MNQVKFRQIAGLTFVEMLSCIAIIAILSSFLFPVFSNAKLGAKTAAAKLNLKNLHLAISLYRLDYEGVEYGEAFEMGLPDPRFDTQNSLIKIIHGACGSDVRKQSPCGKHPKSRDNTFHYYPSNPVNWASWVSKLESRTILFSDTNCNSAEVDIENQFAMKRSLGVALDGHILSMRNDQNPYWLQEFFIRGNQINE